jgi:membrane protein required for colicin V production
MTLTAFDYGALAIVLLSALQGMWRGLLAELFALIGWIAAFFVAAHYASRLAPFLPASLPGGELTRLGLSFVAIVILVLVVAGVLGALLGKLTELIGLRTVDSSLGMLFGLLRGVVLVLVVVALAGFTTLPEQDFWRNAQLLPYAEWGVGFARQFLPPGLAVYVHPGVGAGSWQTLPRPKPGLAPGDRQGAPVVPEKPHGNSAEGNITQI